MYKPGVTPNEDEFHQWVFDHHGIKRPTGAIPPSLQQSEHWSKTAAVWDDEIPSTPPQEVVHHPEPPTVVNVKTPFGQGMNKGDAWMDNRMPFIYHPHTNTVYMGNQGTHHGYIAEHIENPPLSASDGQPSEWRGMINTNEDFTPLYQNNIHWWNFYGDQPSHPWKQKQIEDTVAAKYPEFMWDREAEPEDIEEDWDDEPHYSSNMEDEWVASDEPVFSLTLPESRWQM
jgi:hypothetical protein